MIIKLFRALAHMPLPLLHVGGAVLGWLIWLSQPTYRQRWREHTQQAGLKGWRRWASVAESGKQMAELPRLWFGAPVAVHWDGASWIDERLAQGGGLLLLTPHMGCFEVVGQAYAERFGRDRGAQGPGVPMTVLFRPPRHPAVARLLDEARERPGMHAVPTDLGGVRQMLQALKKGQAVGLLPDQVPPEGQGVWAPFFGRLAYTMTLSGRLAQVKGVGVILIWGERLSWGRGFVIHVRPLAHYLAPSETLSTDPQAAAEQINRVMAAVVRECPQQYLWSYARYKQPRGGAA